MPRTIPETPEPGKRWAELFRGRSWRVYEPPDRLVAADLLSESDARLLVEGPDRMASLEAMLRQIQWRGPDWMAGVPACPICRTVDPAYSPGSQHTPDCRLAALIANLEGG